MKVLIAAVVVVAVVAGGVWVTRDVDDDATSTDGVKSEAGVAAVEADGQPEMTPAGEEKPLSEAATTLDAKIDSAESIDTQDVVEESEAASPFTTVVEPLNAAEPQMVEPAPADEPESVSSLNDAASTGQSDLDNTQRGGIVVPQSYPVTEAGKYFIPKEERGPGNLGGPPPLDFPGGPGDPDGSGSGSTFAPPASPDN